MSTVLLWMFACSEVQKSTTDIDQDGFSDEEEEAAGTNPQDPYSRPYEQGGYDIGYCSEGVEASNGPSQQGSFREGDMEITWSHYQEGDIVENFQLKDQYGQAADLYSFCGNHIMLVVASFT